jgi:TolB-like protein
MFRTFARTLAAALPLLALAAGAEPRLRVAVLPVVVHSLEERAYLQSGIADMLSTRLEQNAGLTIVRVRDAAQATTDGEAARQAARAAGAEFVVFGSFTRFGDGASLDLRCLPVAGAPGDDPRSVFVQAGSVGEIIPRLDDVADKVARYVTSGGGPGTPAVGAGPAVAPGGAPPEALQDALSELDELRARVERLEELLNGREGAAGSPQAPGPGKQP